MSLTLIDAEGVFGTFGTESDHSTTNERPTSFRGIVHKYGLNGMTSLTAVTALSNNRKVDDAKYTWWEKETPLRNGVADLYSNSDLSTAITTGTGAIGDTVYAKVNLATAKHFRAGMHVQLLDVDGNPFNTATARIQGVTESGDSSKIEVTLLEATAANVLGAVDYIQGIGNANAQGSTRPDTVSYKKEEKYNYTQIFREPFSLTRTSRQTYFRTGNKKLDLRLEHLMLHNIAMEEAWFFGERMYDTDEGPEPLTATRGIFNWVKNDASQNFASFAYDTDYSGDTWNASGIDWIEKNLTQLFLYGNSTNTKMAYCGPKFMELMNRTARLNGSIEMRTGATAFGLKVTEWISPFGRVLWKTHPLFAVNAQRQHMAMFVEPGLLHRRIILDTQKNVLNSTEAQKYGLDGYDGDVEEYKTEVGLELHHAKAFGVWNVAETNVV